MKRQLTQKEKQYLADLHYESEQESCEQIEISPYIKSVMEGAPPRYLDDEIEAINTAKKLGWRPKPGEGSPAYRAGSYM